MATKFQLNILSKYITSEKNIKIIGKYIKSDEDLYNVCYLKQSGSSLKEILEMLKNDTLNYSHPYFSDMKHKQELYNNYLENPFAENQIKSIVKCKKCGSDNVMSQSVQDRSADEPASVYSQCISCKFKWRSNN